MKLFNLLLVGLSICTLSHTAYAGCHPTRLDPVCGPSLPPPKPVTHQPPVTTPAPTSILTCHYLNNTLTIEVEGSLYPHQIGNWIQSKAFVNNEPVIFSAAQLMTQNRGQFVYYRFKIVASNFQINLTSDFNDSTINGTYEVANEVVSIQCHD